MRTPRRPPTSHRGGAVTIGQVSRFAAVVNAPVRRRVRAAPAIHTLPAIPADAGFRATALSARSTT